MKKSFLGIVAGVVLFGCSAPYPLTESSDNIFQAGLYNGLVEGNYEGGISIGELQKYGNFGIGTFDGLDGEMVMLDGTIYKISAKGKVTQVSDIATTPFAVVTMFESDKIDSVTNLKSFTALQSVLDLFMHEGNIFHAIKIEGTFTYMKTRSVPKQMKPYKRLQEVLDIQPIFEYQNIKGTMVGFHFPFYSNGINISGFHFHFISADKTKGGHVLDCNVQSAVVSIDETAQFTLHLAK